MSEFKQKTIAKLQFYISQAVLIIRILSFENSKLNVLFESNRI